MKRDTTSSIKGGDGKMAEPFTAPIDNFFRPRGIAVVGASATPGSPNNQIVQYAKQMSLTGKVFPVNPRSEKIAGLQCFPDLMAIPEPVDLIVIAVGARHSLGVAQQIAQRRGEKGDAGAVAVVTAGFKEMATAEGEQLQRDLLDIIKASGARLIGPNCQGVADTYNGVNTTFSVPPNTHQGGVSIISQSAAFATSFLRWARDQKLVGVNKFVSLGNMADLDFRDLLAYMGDDDRTKVIAMYMEGISDAPG
jgi:acetyltransferase